MKYKKVIFVDKNGTSRAFMISEYFKSIMKDSQCEVLARGLLVAFSEPANPIAQAVLATDGINVSDFSSKKICDEDIDDGTIIFAIDEKIRNGILNSIEAATEDNTFDVCGFAGEELTITNPYGGSVTTYGLCYESIKNVIKKVIEIMEAMDE